MKTILKALVLVATLTACGTDGKNGSDGVSGSNGANGAAGKDGLDEDIGNLKKIQAIYTRHRQSVYRIAIQCNGTTYAFGSGFKIANNVVATNRHVTMEACPSGQTKRFKIESVYDNLDTLAATTYLSNGDCPANNAKYCEVTSSYVQSNSYDLSKITISSTLSGTPVTIETSTAFPTTGASVLSLSFPLGFEDLYTLPGIITTNYLGDCYGGSAYQCPSKSYDWGSNVDTDHGSSGSPIFDLNTGKVIGVTSAGTDGENMNTTWAVNAYKLNSF